MHLFYYLDEQGKRVYTLQRFDPSGKLTLTAHPAKFSPENPFSAERLAVKRRFGLLPPSLPQVKKEPPKGK